MHRKKEIIIIVLVILATVTLAFLPMIINSTKSDNTEITETTKNPKTIKIKVTGELKVDEITIKIPYGYSYGYIISKIKLYLNDYSIIDNDKTKRYYEDTEIVIQSSDIKSEPEIDLSDFISINTASASELTTLYGIGDKRAILIIEYRKNKKIESFEELREIIGVSDEVIKRIKEKAIL